MDAIKRDVYVLRDTIQYRIEVTRGTNMIPIELTIRDFNIPTTATAVAYAFSSRNDEPSKMMCDIVENTIKFTPSGVFFETGLNQLMIRIINDGKRLISFEVPVWCKDNKIRESDKSEEDQQTLIEQLLEKNGNLTDQVDKERKRIDNLVAPGHSAIGLAKKQLTKDANKLLQTEGSHTHSTSWTSTGSDDDATFLASVKDKNVFVLDCFCRTHSSKSNKWEKTYHEAEAAITINGDTVTVSATYKTTDTNTDAAIFTVVLGYDEENREIADIRVDSDGVTHDSAGAAVRAQTKDVPAMRDCLQSPYVDVDLLELGNINKSTGAEEDSTKILRSERFRWNADGRITAPTGYTIAVATYTVSSSGTETFQAGSWIGYVGVIGKMDADGDKNVRRLLIKRSDGADINVEDLRGKITTNVSDLRAMDVLKNLQEKQAEINLEDKQDKYILSINRLDITKLNNDSQLNTNTGELYYGDGWKVSDYCDIKTQNETGYFTQALIYDSEDSKSSASRACFYDRNKKYISGMSRDEITTEPIKIPENAYYVRVSGQNFVAGKSYVNIGEQKGFVSQYQKTAIVDLLNVETDEKIEMLKNKLVTMISNETVTLESTTPKRIYYGTDIDYAEFTPDYDGYFAVYYNTSNNGYNTDTLLVDKHIVKKGQIIKANIDNELNQYGIAVRTFESGTSVEYSLYSVPCKNFEKTKEDVTEIKENTQKISEKLDNMISKKIVGGAEKKNVDLTTTFKIADTRFFEIGKKYTINIKDVGTTNKFSHFALYFKRTDATLQMAKEEYGDFSDGVDFEITIPENFASLHGRTWLANTVYSWRAETDVLNEEMISSFEHPLKGKILAFYGDSISAQNNGDFLNQAYGNTWAGYFAKDVEANAYYGRGVGGQTFKWNDTCWYTEKGTNGKYKDRYKYDENGKAINSVVNTSTTEDEIGLIEKALNCNIEIHRGCFCSWDRITTMFPESIKDTIDVLFVMGGTNDFNSVEEVENNGNDGSIKPLFSSEYKTDSDWISSEKYIGGDYDVSTTWGAMASTIMKLKIWMPNCKIVVLTPIERAGNDYNHKTNNNKATTFELAEQIISVAKWCNTEVWNMFAECGIDLFNASEMLSDGVHPNQATGGLRMGKYLASKSVTIQILK